MRQTFPNELREISKSCRLQENELSLNREYAYARNLLDAVDLIGLGARVPLTCNQTLLPKATVRSLFRDIQGRASASGQAPFNDTWYLRSDLRQMHANLICICTNPCHPSNAAMRGF